MYVCMKYEQETSVCMCCTMTFEEKNKDTQIFVFF